MSKEQVREMERRLQDALAAIEGLEQPLSLSRLQQVAQEFAEAQQWLKIAALGDVPLEFIQQEDKERAAGELRLLTVRGLCQDGDEPAPNLTKRNSARYRESLHWLSLHYPCFHERPEADLFMGMLNLAPNSRNTRDALSAFRFVRKALEEKPFIRWLHTYWRVLATLAFQRNGPKLRKPEADAVDSEIPDFAKAFRDGVAILSNATVISESDSVTMELCELKLVAYSTAGESLPVEFYQRAIALAPTVEEVEAYRRTAGYGGNWICSTADWAFILGFAKAVRSPQTLNRVCDLFPVEALTGRARGLWLLARCRTVPAGNVDALFINAIDEIIQGGLGEPAPKGILARTKTGVELVIKQEPSAMSMTGISDILELLRYQMPKGWRRSQELGIVAEILQTASLGLRSKLFLSDEKAISWLESHCKRFRPLFSVTYPEVSVAISWWIECFRTHAESDQSVGYLPLAKFIGDPEQDKVIALLTSVEAVARITPTMDIASQTVWREGLPSMFEWLFSIEDVDTVRKTRQVAEALCGHPQARAIETQAARHLQDRKYRERYSRRHRQAEANGTLGRTYGSTMARPSSCPQAASVDKSGIESKPPALNEDTRVEYERTAPNRWPGLTRPARQLLTTISAVPDCRSTEELALHAGMEEVWVRRHHSVLVNSGMLLLRDGSYVINPAIASYVALESRHGVVSRIIPSSGTSTIKQVLYRATEIKLYQIFVQLCPNHLVFPNYALSSLMEAERVKPLVSTAEYDYYFKASVDAVVVSTITYFPLLAVEFDSPEHDSPRQQENDRKKDRLFATSGIPFTRLRLVGNPSEHVVRGQIAEALEELVKCLRNDSPVYVQAVNLLQDLAGFGGGDNACSM
ncbi:DUF2726 domain-containing protein [Burkholderia gladioli]|uniref:DUF2726 domain-containing protein n=1 Tax=Burkholderia gladioli TaxID=28095 RepID=UPI00163E0B1C|nr:DUF2726 domain-containing protein [Burkholderia gladioli]